MQANKLSVQNSTSKNWRQIMAIQEIQVKNQEQIYSPYSGLPADGDNGPNKKDDTLLFVYYGNSGGFGYISERIIINTDKDPDDLSVDEIKASASIAGAFIVTVDTGWNGLNSYGFAPSL